MLGDKASFRTITLGALGTADNEPQPLAEANLGDLRVRVRAAGTANKIAFLALQANDVRDDNGQVTNRGACYEVPVGSGETIHISHGQALFGISDSTGVRVSVNAARVTKYNRDYESDDEVK